MNGADLICTALKKYGVEHIFLYPGAKNIGIINSIKKLGLQGHLCRHEQGCIFAAEGYAKSSNKVGVVLTTSGPGAANTITGIADAFSDSVPIIILTAQVSVQASGTEAFQEMPTDEIVKPITKSCFKIRRASDICHVIDQAFYQVQHERCRPVLIDIPSNIQTELGEFHGDIIHYPKSETLDTSVIQTFIEMLVSSRAPLLYVGGGCKYGYDLLEQTLKITGPIPSVSSVMGLGSVPGTDPLFLGFIGMHGLYTANYAVTECDLLISLGGRFCERATCDITKFAPRARIIHIDVDISEIGKRVTTHLGICADVRDVLKMLNSKLPLSLEMSVFQKQIEPWCTELVRLKHTYSQERYITCDSEPCKINGQRIVYELNKYCKTHNISPIITTGVGKHQVFTAQIFQHENPWKWITSGALACMGFGIPAAIGASLACPGETVICIEGDGSILMSIQELATLYNEHLPVKIILFNNQILGMVQQIEEEVYHTPDTFTFLGSVHDSNEIYPDFNKIADGFKIRNKCVDNITDLIKAFDEVFENAHPFLLNVIIKDSNVRPEIADGECFENILL